MDVANGTDTPNHLTFAYDADNRITNNSDFSYDANGNLINAKFNNISYVYTYDTNNRLIKVADNNNNTTTYTYDAEGNRITKTVNNVTTTNYHYFDGQLLYETLSSDPSYIIHALYLRTPQGALAGVSLNYNVTSSTNTFYYYHYNAHGDISVVTDSNGNVYRQYTYDP